MELLSVLGIILIGILITLYEMPKINKNNKKEKLIFIILTVGSIVLATLLIYFPQMPGPTQMVEEIFKPFGSLLEESLRDSESQNGEC